MASLMLQRAAPSDPACRIPRGREVTASLPAGDASSPDLFQTRLRLLPHLARSRPPSRGRKPWQDKAARGRYQIP